MNTDWPTRRSFSQIAGVLAVAVLVASGCASSGGSDTASDQTLPNSDITVAASGQPHSGGSLVYGLEAETSGFDATTDKWALSGTEVAFAIFDPLTAFDVNGVAQPYLAESLTPNDDFTVWKVKVRPDVTFQNGESVDAAAGVMFTEAFRQSALTGPAAANIKSAEADPTDPLTEIITMKSPWASFPASLTGQAGSLMAPEQLRAKAEGDQQRASRHPIGTGPFAFKEWIPDSKLVVTRNPHYWRTDESGTRLPYLDQVEFRPIPDVQNRVNSLASGDIDILHTSEPESIKRLQGDARAGRIQMMFDNGEKEETFVMFNTESPPFDDVNARLAVAYATDVDSYLTTLGYSTADAADSAFTKDSIWYHDAGFPRLDLDKAREYLAKYKQDTGSDLVFSLGTTPSPESQRAVQLLSQQWAEVGIKANPKAIEQDKFIADAATGNYQANLWRQFGVADPDVEYVWWTGDNARGPLTLNFARFKNADVDRAISAARASADVNVRKQAYADLQQVWAAQVPYVWLVHVTWAIAAANDVRGIANGPLPDGRASSPFQDGSHRLTQTWIEGG